MEMPGRIGGHGLSGRCDLRARGRRGDRPADGVDGDAHRRQTVIQTTIAQLQAQAGERAAAGPRRPRRRRRALIATPRWLATRPRRSSWPRWCAPRQRTAQVDVGSGHREYPEDSGRAGRSPMWAIGVSDNLDGGAARRIPATIPPKRLVAGSDGPVSLWLK